MNLWVPAALTQLKLDDTGLDWFIYTDTYKASQGGKELARDFYGIFQQNNYIYGGRWRTERILMALHNNANIFFYQQ